MTDKPVKVQGVKTRMVITTIYVVVEVGENVGPPASAWADEKDAQADADSRTWGTYMVYEVDLQEMTW